jgi:hypothetical protein
MSKRVLAALARRAAGHPPIEPEPKRFIFSQPIAELRPQAVAQGAAAQPQTLPQQDMQRSTAEAWQPK